MRFDREGPKQSPNSLEVCKKMATKKQNRRLAKKRAFRLKHNLLDIEAPVKRDSMSAARRGYGQGLSIDG